MKNKKDTPLILFDLDGTLWDCSELSYQAWTRSLELLGVPHNLTKQRLKSFFGLSSPVFERKLFPEFPDKLRSKLAENAFGFELSLIREGFGILYPDVEGILERLSSQYDMAIVSNCQNGYIEGFIKHYGFEQFFKNWESSGHSRKPKEENIRQLMARMNKNTAIMVGDTPTDMNAAHFNNIPFIHALYGFGVIPEVEYKVACFSQLPGCIDSMIKEDAIEYGEGK